MLDRKSTDYQIAKRLAQYLQSVASDYNKTTLETNTLQKPQIEGHKATEAVRTQCPM